MSKQSHRTRLARGHSREVATGTGGLGAVQLPAQGQPCRGLGARAEAGDAGCNPHSIPSGRRPWSKGMSPPWHCQEHPWSSGCRSYSLTYPLLWIPHLKRRKDTHSCQLALCVPPVPGEEGEAPLGRQARASLLRCCPFLKPTPEPALPGS